MLPSARLGRVMPAPAPVTRHSRKRQRRGRGRRPKDVPLIARERMDLLFTLAATSSRGGEDALADRYVQLASTIGTRYNLRLRPEQRHLVCRGCRRYMVPGRTARVRVRGRWTQTCSHCKRIQRVPIHASSRGTTARQP